MCCCSVCFSPSASRCTLLFSPFTLSFSISFCSPLVSFFTLLLAPVFLLQRLDVLTSIYSMSPPEGGVWDSTNGATGIVMCVHMPDGLTVQVPVRRDQTASDLVSAACKVGMVAGCHHRERTISPIDRSKKQKSNLDLVS